MKKALMVCVSIMVVALTIISAVSASITNPNIDYPFTRFSHDAEWCMYYTGDAMCWVPTEYCNQDRTQRQYRWGDFGPCPEPLVNNAPEIKLPKLKITVQETETVVIGAKCEDPEGEEVTVTYSGWMTKDTKKTGYNDAGEYKVKVTCEDARGESSSLKVKVAVENKNRAPVFVDWSN